jgi:hypothetical protein
MMRLISVLSLGLFTVGLTGSAFAEKPLSKAAREKVAKKACAMGDAQKGADILTDLLVEFNEPTYIYNQGRCYQQNNLFSQAISRFREYLRKAKDIAESDRTETERQIADCEQSLAKATPAMPPPAYEPSPTPATHMETEAQPTGLVAAKAPSNPEPSPPATGQGKGLRVAGSIVAAVGVATVGAGVGLALKSQSLSTKDYSQSREDQRASLRTWGLVSYGVGAAAIITGAILYVVGWPSDPSTGVALLPVAAPDGASILLRGRF